MSLPIERRAKDKRSSLFLPRRQWRRRKVFFSPKSPRWVSRTAFHWWENVACITFLRPVCSTYKSDLGGTTKCDQIDVSMRNLWLTAIIGIFIFCHPFHIMRQFPKFEIGWNDSEKFWIGNNESEKLQNSMELDETVV